MSKPPLSDKQAENIRSLVIDIVARARVNDEITEEEFQAINTYLANGEASLRTVNSLLYNENQKSDRSD